MNAPLPDLRGEHRTEPIPPEPHRLMAYTDTTLEQQIFYLSQRQRLTGVHHHRAADYLGWAIEIAEGVAHRRRLGNAPARFKPYCTDTTLRSGGFST